MNSTSRRTVLPPSDCSLPLPLLNKGGGAVARASSSPLFEHSDSSAAAPRWLGTFNRSNNLVGSLLWYYRACWHQNLAQIAFAGLFAAGSSPNRENAVSRDAL